MKMSELFSIFVGLIFIVAMIFLSLAYNSSHFDKEILVKAPVEKTLLHTVKRAARVKREVWVGLSK